MFNNRNLGFAGGMNVGIHEALSLGARYVLLMNNDGFPESSMVDSLWRFMESNHSVGAAGPLVLAEAPPHQVLFGGRRLNRLTGELMDLRTMGNEPLQVNMIEGSALMLRASVLDSVGALQEALFIYWEDAELCHRIAAAGYGVYLVPGAVFYHSVAGSTPRVEREYLLARNKWLFWWCIRKTRKTWVFGFYGLTLGLLRDIGAVARSSRRPDFVAAHLFGQVAGLKAVVGRAPPMTEETAYRRRLRPRW